MVTRLTVIFGLILFFSVNALAKVNPIARIDRSVIALDDTVTLTIRVEGSGSHQSPDLTPLKRNFQILGNSQSSRHSIRNGKSESWTEWTISLMPKRKGQLAIPPINVAGGQTGPLSIQVHASVPVSADNLKPVFLESEVDSNSVYVQQQIIFTLRIFQSIQLDNMNISEPEFSNAAVEKLGQNSFQRRIQNTPYRVHELRYAIFPQEIGEFEIPALQFTANEAAARRSVFSLHGQGRPIRKNSQPLRIEVKAPPANFNGNVWLPAESLNISDTWSLDPDDIHVGDSITRTITTRAQGLVDSQLPPIEIPATSGLKLYPDQGTTQTSASENGVSASRQDSIAIIPTQAGHIELPEISISWWDTKNNELRYAKISATTLNIKPAIADNQVTSTPLAVDHSGAQSNIATPSPPANDKTIPWKILSLLLALGWISSFFIMRRRLLKTANKVIEPIAQRKETEKALFDRLLKNCSDNDPMLVRSSLIKWGQSLWPSVYSLEDIRRQCHEIEMEQVLNKLDEQLYGNAANALGPTESLIPALKRERAFQLAKPRVTNNALPPLYAN